MHVFVRVSRATTLAAVGMIVSLGCAAPAASSARVSAVPPITSSTERTVAHAGAPSDALRVMSVNCRFATLLDLGNTWAMRKELLVRTIRNFDPDLLGTQECLARQSDYLKAQFPGYAFFGAGRGDGERRGEMCGVFYRADRFERLDGGHFWLSETPEKPGSKGWGAFFPRMVTWVKLRPLDGTTPPFCWFNTHLDAFSARARANGAGLLRERIERIAGPMPVVLTGDFNAGEGSDPHRLLVDGSGMTDTFRAVNAGGQADSGTHHAFRGRTGGPRIDWILAGAGFRTVDAGIDRTRDGRAYPSDHFPVTAVLRPAAAGRTVAQVE